MEEKVVHKGILR